PFGVIVYNKWGSPSFGFPKITLWLLLPPFLAIILAGGVMNLPTAKVRGWVKLIIVWVILSVAVYWMADIVRSHYQV
ncbi:MAG: hypothetical protein ACRDRQ_27625, partial [Pseudonocardiaceae bacterium]